MEQGGCSQIVDFNGNRLAYDQEPHESVATSAIIDIEALRAARRDRGMGNGLLRSRWHMYRDYFGGAEFYPANQLLQRPIETMADLDPVLDRALDNLIRAGVIG